MFLYLKNIHIQPVSVQTSLDLSSIYMEKLCRRGYSKCPIPILMFQKHGMIDVRPS